MKLITSSEQTQQDTTAVEEAEHLFASVRARLFAVIKEIEAGSSDRAKTLAPLLGELRKSWHAARDERKRVHELGKTDTGAVGGETAIDFARARNEVERRLDRLRGSEGSGGFSEQS